MNAVTGAAVVKLPKFSIVKPYALAGGGALVFSPRDANSIDSQTRGAFVYGAGVDIPVTKHVDLRGQYRGFVYKVPDFDRASFHTDSFTHAAIPSAGFVFTF